MEHYLGFQHAWMLLLLPPAWATCYWAARRQATQGNSRPATFLLQALLITLLVLAVSGPSLRLSSAGSTTVLVVDTSGSMRGVQVSASDIIESTRRRLARVPGARLGIVVLGRQARVALRPQLAEDAEAFADITLPQIPQDATDIAAGLATALAMIPDAGQIILWSDGMETTGDADAEARLAASHGVRIHVWRPAKAALPDAQILGLRLPPRIQRGQPARIRVGLKSTTNGPAGLTISRRGPDGKLITIERRSADLVAGRTVFFSFSDMPIASGIFTYSARVALSGDAFRENDAASAALEVEGGWRATYLFGNGNRPGRLAEILKSDNLLHLNIASADTVSFDALSDSQLVVLDNLSGDDLAAGDWSRLHTYVKDMGGSILVIGGDQSFGLGRYDELSIAPALPVVSAPGSKRAVALVVVLDVSGSMGEEVGGTAKLAVAKQAIMGLRQVLSKDDRVGVVAFSASPRVVSEPVSAEQWEELRQKVLALDAGGGTRITPALEAAEEMLRPAEDQTVRHVLLLSDGESADFEARKMAEAFRAGKISVSTVATGKQVDRDKLSFLARQTGGRFYEMKDLRRLAATFLKDLLQAKHKVVSREPAAVEWKEPRPVWPPRVPPVPDVPYHLITSAKSEARVHLVTTAGTPIAVSWRHGLGKVAVLPVSLHESDNAAWAKWPDLPGFLWPIVNWLRARPRPAGWNLTLNQQDATLQIEVRVPAREAAKQALAFSASTVTPRGNLETTPLEHTAPGIFSATVKAAEQGTYWVSVQQKDSGGQAWQRESITLGPSAEWRQTGLDEKGLGNIARTTGGTVIEADEQMEGLALMQTDGLQPVGLYLLYAAAAVFVAEICARLLRRD